MKCGAAAKRRGKFGENMKLHILETTKEYLFRNQPYRFILKSVRNLFFPVTIHIDVQKTIGIEVSSICDAKCIFCNYKFGVRKKNLLSVDEFRTIAHSCAAMGYEHLDLTSLGGEILVHKDIIEIITIAKTVGFKSVGSYTNGILLHRFNIQDFLQSGIDTLLISFPGFDKNVYEQVFGVDKYDEFIHSILLLLETHHRIHSPVEIFFEPRTYLSLNEIKNSDFFKNSIARYFDDRRVKMTEPLRVFDTWGGEITKKDLIKDMRLDVNPIKSISPLKKTYQCARLNIFGVQANGDVRMCNCRYDSSVETENDSLYIANYKQYSSLEELFEKNQTKIETIKNNFTNGTLPSLCRRCPFYVPVKNLHYSGNGI